MSEELPNTSGSPGPFDVPTVQSLVNMMSEHDISEIDLREGNQRIRLVRGGTVSMAMQTVPQLPMAGAVQAHPIVAESAASSPPPQPSSKTLYEVKSPTPGTFYARPKPDEAPYVKQGSKVEPETTVGLIEAMKVYTEIPAEVSGVVAEILVQNGQPVEYNTVLFRIDTGA
ncbi:MAG: acetyl-CoA carboxylase biotin carboxyl carrier protein [Gemmataceae bacterium]